MKLKKIESICKRSKTISIISDGNNQWIGEYGAYYLIEDLPTLSKEQIFAIFDIQPDQQEKYSFSQMNKAYYLILDDNFKTDNSVDIFSEFTLTADGTEIIPVETSQGLKFIAKRYLKPFDKEQITVFERTSDTGSLYFIVKKGMFIKAVILPLMLKENGKSLKEWSVRFAQAMKSFTNDFGLYKNELDPHQPCFDELWGEDE